MNTTQMKIGKGQYLASIVSEIPTNTILFKTLTGIGATHLELQCKRNSIIVEPNVPVIRGKRKKGILGIFEGITPMDVVVYLSNKQFTDKKILVTPESFHKVKEAMDYLGIDMYGDYFLLFDECDRTAKDVDFRGNIIAPMDDFFKFKNKAFVSATAMVPSDPRFAKQGFSIMEVTPTFDYAKDLRLVNTNNSPLAFKQEVMDGQHGEDAVFCIFFNSINGIASLIDQMGIGAQSAVFCSKDRVRDLPKSIACKSDTVDTDKFNKYNFFTSRFHAAVDIELEYRPHVVMYTDLFMAEHSMIDPHSDAVQIVGRFRQGVSSITVIANHNTELPCKTTDEAESYLQGCKESYGQIRSLHKAATNIGARETLQQALLLVPYAKFVNDDGSTNHFMHDHYHYNERLKFRYTHPDNLSAAYQSDGQGNRNRYFKMEAVQLDFHMTDREMERERTIRSFREKVVETVAVLDRVLAPSGMMFSLDDRQVIIDELTKSEPNIFKGYRLLGREEMLKIIYSAKDLERAIAIKEKKNARSDFKFIHDLHEKFSDGVFMEQTALLKEFGKVIEKHGLPLKANMTEFGNFFEVGGRTTNKKFGRNKKVQKIIKSKFNRS